MDLATLIGLAVAWGALVVALVLEGGGAKQMLNLPAFVLVVFGAAGATVAGMSVRSLRSLPAVLRTAVTDKPVDPTATIDMLIALARLRRREGILALERAAIRIQNRFFRKAVELIVDGTPGNVVREILESEIAAMQERHRVGQSVFASLGGFSPTLGIIGTVLGLIGMLAKLNEPGRMGHAIATAFVATLYGVALANLLYLPIAGKLRSRSAEEVTVCEMIIEGVLAIQTGENPRIVEMRAAAFLPPTVRAHRVPRSEESLKERWAA